MKMARAHLGTQAEVAPEGAVSRAAMSRNASRGGAFGQRLAVLAFFGVVGACNVYDESLLPKGTGGGGGVTGNGGSAPAGGGGGTDAPPGTGGSGGSSGTPMPDASQGGGGTTGGGGMGGVLPDSSVAPDVVARDANDGAAPDRADTSVTVMCPLLIDDLEITGGQINDGCRNGFWFTYNDGTVGGSQSPAAGTAFMPQAQSVPRPPSTKAAHTVGSGYQSAGMGVNFNAPPGTGSTRAVYNASAYIGVTFWALGAGNISVALPDKDTDPTGGICAVGGRGPCFDHFQAPIVLTTSWQQYTVLFSQLRQKGFGYPAPGGFDRSAVFGIQWGVTAGGTFDFWIDDVSFITSITDAGGQ